MEFRLKPTNKNGYPIGAVLIKGTSPTHWLEEIQAMGLVLETASAYAIPGDKANVLYGCLVVLSGKPDSKLLGRNTYLQLIDGKLFLPEFATVTPVIGSDEWENLMPGNQYVMLPETGLFSLEEKMDWSELLEFNSKVNVKISVPLKSVMIPKTITSYRVEIDQANLLDALTEPLSEEEAFEKLPFDMKKLMNGNQREMEKYLAFMDKNPDMALKYALPLDVLGTARGNNNGKFSFNGGFFDNFFGDFNSGSDSKLVSFAKSKIVIVVIAVFFLYNIGVTIFKDSNGSKSPIDFNSKFVLVSFIVIMAFLILKLLFTSSLGINLGSTHQQSVGLVMVLLLAVGVLIFPLYNAGELDNAFSIILLVILGIIIYRVFDSSKTLIKRDEK